MSIYLTLNGKKVSSDKDIKDFVQKTVASAMQKKGFGTSLSSKDTDEKRKCQS